MPILSPHINNNLQQQRPQQPCHFAQLHGASSNDETTDAPSSSSSANVEEDDDNDKSSSSSNPFKQAYHLYIDYFDRLWSETDVDQRQKLARQRAKDAILHVKNMVSSSGMGEEYLWKESSVAATAATTNSTTTTTTTTSDGNTVPSVEEEVAVFADLDENVRQNMENACDLMLEQLEEENNNTRKKKKGIEMLKDKLREDTGRSTSYEEVGNWEKTSSSSTTTNKDSLPVINEQGDLVSPPAYASSSTGSTNETELTKALTGVVAKEEEKEASSVAVATIDETKKTKKKKGGRSVLFGATMGLVVACWVYSGNYIFTALFTLMTALGQLEYYRMVMNTGVYPARRISVLGACAMFVTALFAPDLHQICLPVVSTWAMIWFLVKRSSISTISEIATTFTGMFYLGEYIYFELE